MKNNFFKLIICILINIFIFNSLCAEDEFEFNITEIDITDNGDLILGSRLNYSDFRSQNDTVFASEPGNQGGPLKVNNLQTDKTSCYPQNALQPDDLLPDKQAQEFNDKYSTRHIRVRCLFYICIQLYDKWLL